MVAPSSRMARALGSGLLSSPCISGTVTHTQAKKRRILRPQERKQHDFLILNRKKQRRRILQVRTDRQTIQGTGLDIIRAKTSDSQQGQHNLQKDGTFRQDSISSSKTCPVRQKDDSIKRNYNKKESGNCHVIYKQHTYFHIPPFTEHDFRKFRNFIIRILKKFVLVQQERRFRNPEEFRYIQQRKLILKAAGLQQDTFVQQKFTVLKFI